MITQSRGTGELETAIRKAGKGYVLGVAANHRFHSWGKKLMVRGSAATITRNIPKNAWRRLSAGDGTKGARLHDWAYLELADLDAGKYNGAQVLLRPRLTKAAQNFFATMYLFLADCARDAMRKRA